jgi:hypothetical protein
MIIRNYSNISKNTIIRRIALPSGILTPWMYLLILVRTEYILGTYYAIGCTGYLLGRSYQCPSQYKSVRTDQEKIKKYILSTYKICSY